VDKDLTFSREYWRQGDLTCTLTYIDGNVAVTLMDGLRMIALQACGNYLEASSVASFWKTHRPRTWPRDADLL
jgi:hypothetical protein